MSIFLSKLRSCSPVFGIALLLTLTALVLTLNRAAAQQNVPAASAPAGKSAAAQPAQSPSSSDDEGDAQFLHSSAVQSVARILHLKLDTAVTLLLGINFAIIFFAIVIPLTRYMPKMIRKRSQTLSQDLNDAHKATADAQARLSAVEAQLAGLGEEIKKLSAQVEKESLEDEKRIKAALGEESARIVTAAEQEIDVAVTQAKRGLRSFAADLAIGRAEKQMALSVETDRALIDEFVAGVAGAAKEGRN